MAWILCKNGMIPEGELEITENGTYDVTDYASADVSVPNPSTGTKNITANGTYDVTDFASANVSVPNPSTGTKNITANGTYNVTDFASAAVAVPDPMSVADKGTNQNSTTFLDNTSWNVTSGHVYAVAVSSGGTGDYSKISISITGGSVISANSSGRNYGSFTYHYLAIVRATGGTLSMRVNNSNSDSVMWSAGCMQLT